MSPLRVSIIGTGYVGTETGICFPELGHSIIFIDIVQSVLDKIKSGKSPIYEPGLEELLQKDLGHSSVSRDFSSTIANSDLTFICVGTPSRDDGMTDLKYIKSASRAIGVALNEKEDYHSVIVKSTVLPETTEQINCQCIEKTSGKKSGIGFGFGINPEFLCEDGAINDFFNPDRIIIGLSDPKTEQMLIKIYTPIHNRKVSTSIKVAELIKYASNAFLATKISFANEIGNLCKRLKIDSNEVRLGRIYYLISKKFQLDSLEMTLGVKNE
jgi:UDPglucose 6-dehydrogenase